MELYNFLNSSIIKNIIDYRHISIILENDFFSNILCYLIYNLHKKYKTIKTIKIYSIIRKIY